MFTLLMLAAAGVIQLTSMIEAVSLPYPFFDYEPMAMDMHEGMLMDPLGLRSLHTVDAMAESPLMARRLVRRDIHIPPLEILAPMMEQGPIKELYEGFNPWWLQCKKHPPQPYPSVPYPPYPYPVPVPVPQPQPVPVPIPFPFPTPAPIPPATTARPPAPAPAPPAPAPPAPAPPAPAPPAPAPAPAPPAGR